MEGGAQRHRGWSCHQTARRFCGVPSVLFARDWHLCQGACLFSAHAPTPHDPEYESRQLGKDGGMEFSVSFP